MKNKEILTLLESLPKINLTEKKTYSILNPFYNRISQKELIHSEILASFLNINENHNHSFLFLEQFLIDIKLVDEAKNLDKFENIRVYTERKIRVSEKDNFRPIDILITWEYRNVKNAIIIENKLNYAIDQPNQLNDYYKGIENENFKVKKVVYIHIDQHIIKTKDDVSNDVFKCLINYNSDDLINSLETCYKKKNHSHINEYINLLKNNVQNYKYMETALKIQNRLLNNQESYNKLVDASKIINSKEWHLAKFKIICSNLIEDFVKDDKFIFSEIRKANEFNAYYISLYFEGQKYWLDLWSFDYSVKLFICCKEENKNEIQSEFKNIEFDSNWGSWNYFKTKGSYIDFPSKSLVDFKKLIKKNLDRLKELKYPK